MERRNTSSNVHVVPTTLLQWLAAAQAQNPEATGTAKLNRNVLLLSFAVSVGSGFRAESTSEGFAQGMAKNAFAKL